MTRPKFACETVFLNRPQPHERGDEVEKTICRMSRKKCSRRGIFLPLFVFWLSAAVFLRAQTPPFEGEGGPLSGAVSGTDEKAVKAEKLCWAHYVPWGFDQVGRYDRWFERPEILNPLNDRSLLGRNIQWDSGVYGGTRREIDVARLWGFDGFCVDTVRIDQANSILGRFFRAAEGTDFRIALCIDNGPLDVAAMIEGLAAFLQKYGDHPNMARRAGRPMIFAYNLSLDRERWGEVRSTLAGRGLDAYYVVRPPRSEISLWNDADALADVLAGAEGLYDFGCNGFTLEQMTERLEHGRKAVDQFRPDGLLIAGIAPGYVGASNSYYRPFLNSESFRNNWEAAIRARADQVCLTTWNDYNEQTQIEPSALNRTALLRLNREYLRRWRGEERPKRPPEAIVSYHEEFLTGDDWTIETVSFPYDTKRRSATIRLLDESGAIVRLFDPIPLDPEKLAATTLRMLGEELLSHKTLRVQIAVTEDKSENDSSAESDAEPFWRELYPVTRRSSRLESLRTVRIPLAETSDIPIRLEIKETDEKKRAAVITLKTWAAAGFLELLRNGLPVAEVEIDHQKKPFCTVEIPLPNDFRIPEEFWVARYRDCSDSVAFSNPVTAILPETSKAVELPILETGADFDENWPAWYQRVSRFDKPRVLRLFVPKSDIFSVRYDFGRDDETLLCSETQWKIPIQLVSGKTPVVRETISVTDETDKEGSNKGERTALRFDGDDAIRFPNRFFPCGAFTLSITIQPDAAPTSDGDLHREQSEHSGEVSGGGSDGADQSGGTPLFCDSALTLRLDERNRPTVLCREVTLAASEPISTDRPTRLTVTHDLSSAALFVDGREAARAEVAPKRTTINSAPLLGAERNGPGFRGLLFDFSLEAAAPEKF